MTTGTKSKAQIHMDEKIIENPELLELLEKREDLKGYVADYRKADKAAKSKINEVTEQRPYRVGRFVIYDQKIEEKEVAFTVNESSSIRIKTLNGK